MLLCPGDSPGKNTGADCRAFLQEIIATQDLTRVSSRLLHWQAASLPLVPPGRPLLHDSRLKCSVTIVSALTGATLCHRGSFNPYNVLWKLTLTGISTSQRGKLKHRRLAYMWKTTEYTPGQAGSGVCTSNHCSHVSLVTNCVISSAWYDLMVFSKGEK